MSTTQPGADGHAASDAVRPDAGRRAARRIDCDPANTNVPRTAPARGGGVRDPQEWRQLRSGRG